MHGPRRLLTDAVVRNWNRPGTVIEQVVAVIIYVFIVQAEGCAGLLHFDVFILYLIEVLLKGWRKQVDDQGERKSDCHAVQYGSRSFALSYCFGSIPLINIIDDVY